MVLSVEEKEKLKQQRLEALRKGREAARLRRGGKSILEAREQEKQAEKDAKKPEAESVIKPDIPPEVISSAKIKESARPEKLARSWIKLVGGGILLAVGVMLVIVGNTSKTAIVIAIGAALAAGGGYLAYQGWQQYDVRYGGKKGGVKGKPKLRDANVLKITPTIIQFDKLDDDKLIDVPQRNRNDGKYYHLFFQGMDNGNLTPFVLPDPDPKERYYSPAEALNCLRMELARKYFNYQVSPTAVVSMVVIGVIIAIELVTLIAMGG